MKNKSTVGWIVGLAILVIGLLVWSRALQNTDPDLVARGAFHWHSTLAMYVKGEKLEIPSNIGLGAVHQPVHTHDDSDKGIVHLEFAGSARTQEVTLGVFFKNWGKDIRSFGTNMKMTVNGEENTEYENYVMHDTDKIELHYE